MEVDEWVGGFTFDVILCAILKEELGSYGTDGGKTGRRLRQRGRDAREQNDEEIGESHIEQTFSLILLAPEPSEQIVCRMVSSMQRSIVLNEGSDRVR